MAASHAAIPNKRNMTDEKDLFIPIPLVTLLYNDIKDFYPFFLVFS